MGKLLFAFVALGLLATTVVIAADSDPINDFCVADLTSKILFNGLVCKDPATVTGADFAFTGLEKAGDTNNSIGVGITPGFAGVNFPALNTQGLSVARVDYAVGGLLVPHTHPRATELLYVIQGELYVGFVDTNDKFYPTVIRKGDVYVFPRGLVHFQFNIGKSPAVALGVLNSQNPGVQLMANALFGAQPPIMDAVLAKAFIIPTSEVEIIKKGFGA
jgi:quercetin dioxygenase-like cupin family protein